MNKIGFNVLAWTAGISESLYPIIERLKTIGYDGVELFISNQDVEVFRQAGDFIRSTGLEATSVFVLGKDENPIDPSPAVRARALDAIKRKIDRAQALNASLIVGPFHSAHTVFANHAPEEDEYKLAAEVLHAAGAYAAQADITLCPEALNRFECYLCNTMEQLLKLVRLADHPNVQGMFDSHHANVEEKSFAGAIETISPVLRHVHISENDRGTPGEGHVNFDEIFASLAQQQYKGWLTIEAFSRNDPDFANAIGVWREFSKPWDIAEKGYAFIQSKIAQYHL
ncbi:sugar phosphate isomerase/epimerase [Ravibacter arvi]|uniref:Sugar phosphate isomerase/epimerase n=1 Tax=Ravibacter arvi TaxID=2051041 RepID=A0ABP8LMK8_9BACT